VPPWGRSTCAKPNRVVILAILSRDTGVGVYSERENGSDWRDRKRDAVRWATDERGTSCQLKMRAPAKPLLPV
jgi:hypothetical protein